MGVTMMRNQGITVGSILALAVGVAACSSSTAPNGGGNGGGGGGASSNTITASSTTTGGAYGSGGNYFFSPTPDTVAAGTSVTYMFGSVTHNVHFTAVANAPDSIPSSTNTSVSRTFTTAGTYAYKCLIHNISGVVVVH
jgi:plastocyanin